MKFVWSDYDHDTMQYVEEWLDEQAVRMTGIDDGFRDNYEYWASEGSCVPGVNFWCKVVLEDGIPFALIELGLHEDIVTVMETIVSPEMRGQGWGSQMLAELLANGESIIGHDIDKAEAIIYPSNTASKKAFEKAGFMYHHTHEDGDAMIYIYNKN